MNKTYAIAKRDYLAAVKTKAFVISVVLLPLIMAGGIIVQRLTERMGDTSDKKIAVIDRTPGSQMFEDLVAASERRNSTEILDPQTGRQVKSRFVFELVPTPPEEPGAVERLRLDLSEKVRKGELFAFVEIGKSLLNPAAPTTMSALADPAKVAKMSMDEQIEAAEKALGDDNLIRYSSNRPTFSELPAFLRQALVRPTYQKRLASAGLEFVKVMPLLTPPQVANRGLSILDSSGEIRDEPRKGQIATFATPIALLMLMFLIVMVGASPLTTNVIEEKQLRIAEVLLGSVRPFELMMGKLLGGAAVALTLAVVYFVGAYVVARQFDVARHLSPSLIGWFLAFTTLGTLMYGAMFVAAGAAVTNVKEAQSFITPVMLLVVTPMFVLGNLLNDPGGKVAVFATLFPFSSPMVTMARIAIPPGIPLWQGLAALLITLLTTIALVWMAGRIFRVGMLAQGQAPRLGELARWILHG
jgi:ABC-2 type transport system permease protein